ncbi:MAG: tRNA (adenosine(37)-N6)-threonylcarbamoyltransferase complex transferase subunit TsaD [Patescibacteria group bacterium]|nr:tRNA (adenosine(37)-N6)-threonylcarbamoyltransferase complex transferase subunit TsaD [Patescibacteria group bacterium]
MIILGIETSCDDTSISLVKKNAKGFKILSNVVSSQIKIHATYGGVVPNLAAREHLKNIEPCLKQAMKEAKNPKIDLIAVTHGPGLIPSLLVGVNFAKALAYNCKKPIIGINHIEGHIYANWLDNSKIEFPVLALVVSGGHTQLVLMEKHNKYKLLGETRDDAVGEAFDKVAKLLGLGYPGGPIISQRAEKGNPKKFNLPRPMMNRQNFDFSFSGLKTAVLYEVRKTWGQSPVKLGLSPDYINDMAASFQQAAIDVLINKTIKAAKKYKVKNVILSGGVAANQELRNQLQKAVKKELSHVSFKMPEIKLCTDNAAMIAAVAFYKQSLKLLIREENKNKFFCSSLTPNYKKKPTSKQSWLHINANSNLKLFT